MVVKMRDNRLFGTPVSGMLIRVEEATSPEGGSPQNFCIFAPKKRIQGEMIEELINC